MFRFFGGVPKLLVPDNLKSDLIKASFYDPEINRTQGRDGDALFGCHLPHAAAKAVARQSGWEGGDDQECILTVAAD